MKTQELTPIEQLTEQLKGLIDSGKDSQTADYAAESLGIKLSVVSIGYGKYFPDDKDARYVFKMRLKRGRKQYTFSFGQSISAGQKEPTMYDVLSCMTKYDVGSFEDFCGEFGYDTDSRKAERIYKAVCKEFAAMERLFNSEELEALSYIQ